MSSPSRSLSRATPAPLPLPEPRPAEPIEPGGAKVYRGLSLRPRDAVDPYHHNRFAPDQVGIAQLGAWCPGCQGSLLVVEMTMTEQGLYLEGVCYSCGRDGRRPGIYKRLVIPLPWGRVPRAED